MKSWVKKGLSALLISGVLVGGSQGVASAYIATPPQWPAGQHPRDIYDYDGDNYVMVSDVYWQLDKLLQDYTTYLFGAPLNPGNSIEYAIGACRNLDEYGSFIGTAENLTQQYHWYEKQNNPQQYEFARYFQYWMVLGAIYYVCPDQWNLVPANMKGY